MIAIIASYLLKKSDLNLQLSYRRDGEKGIKMSEAYLEYLLETETDENVIWSAIERFKAHLDDEDLDKNDDE